MTFDDLPADWPQRPLTDPRLLDDVLDLMVGERDRRQRSLVVLACDAEVRLIQPVAIGPLTTPCDPDLVQRTVDILVEALGDDTAGALVIALARPDGLSITADDRAWVDAARAALVPTRWRLSSAHVVTLHGSRAIADPPPAHVELR